MRSILPVSSDFIPVAQPTNVAASAVTSKLVDMANCQGLQFIFVLPIGIATQKPTVRLQQCAKSDGSDAKELKISRAYYKLGDPGLALLVDRWKKDAAIHDRAPAATFAVPGDSDISEVIVCLHVDGADLDTNEGFRYVRGMCNAVGTATARLVAINVVPDGLAYSSLGHASLLAV